MANFLKNPDNFAKGEQEKMGPDTKITEEAGININQKCLLCFTKL